MIKKSSLFLGSVFLFLFSISGVFNANVVHARTISLSFAHMFPASHYQASVVYTMWKEEIEALGRN